MLIGLLFLNLNNELFNVGISTIHYSLNKVRINNIHKK